MTRAVSSAFKSAAYAQETSEVFIVLIELDHADLGNPIRVSSDAVNTTHNGDTYIAYPFELVLPDDPEKGRMVGRLRIDNVQRDIVTGIRSISSPLSVVIRIVLATDPDTVEVEFDGFELVNVSYDALTVTGDISIESLMGEPYPGGAFLPSNFPGLF